MPARGANGRFVRGAVRHTWRPGDEDKVFEGPPTKGETKGKSKDRTRKATESESKDGARGMTQSKAEYFPATAQTAENRGARRADPIRPACEAARSFRTNA